MGWTVEFEPLAFAELQGLDRVARRHIPKFLRERISSRDLGKPLAGDKAGLWRYREGYYRLICDSRDQNRSVVIIRISHRKDAYR